MRVRYFSATLQSSALKEKSLFFSSCDFRHVMPWWEIHVRIQSRSQPPKCLPFILIDQKKIRSEMICSWDVVELCFCCEESSRISPKTAARSKQVEWSSAISLSQSVINNTRRLKIDPLSPDAKVTISVSNSLCRWLSLSTMLRLLEQRIVDVCLSPLHVSRSTLQWLSPSMCVCLG